MKIYILGTLFLITIFSSCSRNIEVSKRDGALYLENADMELLNVKLREWKVGKLHNPRLLSRGDNLWTL
jgi:hypothetical protein